MIGALFVGATIAASSTTASSTPRLGAGMASGIPHSVTNHGVPEVGALYVNASTRTHTCTASVIHSSSRSLLVTAAHCVVGSAVGMIFAPEQHGTQSPLGRWRVTAAYVEPAWKRDQDPDSDIAFLRVASMKIRGRTRAIEQVTGALRFGSTVTVNQRVAVTGYPAGSGNDPITCVTRVYITEEFPSFNCHGFVGGTSGSPWIVSTSRGGEIVGVIGGLHQGGCYEYTSYSSPLLFAARAAYRRAAKGVLADIVPQSGADGC